MQLLKNISYIFTGSEQINSNIVVKKLSDMFYLESIILSGVGSLNWSFIEAGICDEIRLVIAPVAER